ncbi:MAG: hypothetical protein JKY84_11210 [Emcibacteraceae bacterium]|nr:hypothetical protein [Emcibacteraceae bacterium]
METRKKFLWIGEDKVEREYNCYIRYSNHCYTEEIKNGRVELVDDVIFIKNKVRRVFCPVRYENTQEINKILSNIFDKPNIKIGVTSKNNCHVFKLYHNIKNKDKLCVFFSIKNRGLADITTRIHDLKVTVESAYVRSNKVTVKGNQMLGRIADRVINKRKIL